MAFRKSLFCAAIVASSFGTSAYAETLSGQEVQALMVGNTINWVTPDSVSKGVATYNQNGTGTVRVTAPDKFNDAGTWRINGNRFCSTWQIIRDGAERCSTVRTTNQSGVYRTDTVFFTVR